MILLGIKVTVDPPTKRFCHSGALVRRFEHTVRLTETRG